MHYFTITLFYIRKLLLFPTSSYDIEHTDLESYDKWNNRTNEEKKIQANKFLTLFYSGSTYTFDFVIFMSLFILLLKKSSFICVNDMSVKVKKKNVKYVQVLVLYMLFRKLNSKTL